MRSEWQYHVIVRNRAMCPPACRMVFLSGWADATEEGCLILPVLAIERCTLEQYRSMKDSAPPASMKPDELSADGYFYHDSAEVTGEIFQFDESLRSTTLTKEVWDLHPYEVVVCQWPQEEDETRLAEKITELKSCARERYKKLEQDEAKARSKGRKKVARR